MIPHRLLSRDEALQVLLDSAPFLPTVAEAAMAGAVKTLAPLSLSSKQRRNAFADQFRTFLLSELNRELGKYAGEPPVALEAGLRNGIALRPASHPYVKIRFLGGDGGAQVHSPSSTSRLREYGQELMAGLDDLVLCPTADLLLVLLWVRTAEGLALHLVCPRSAAERRKGVSVHWAIEVPHALELLDAFDRDALSYIESYEDLDEYRLRAEDRAEDGDEPA